MIEVWLFRVRKSRMSQVNAFMSIFACNLQLPVEYNVVLVPFFCWIEVLYLNLGVFLVLPLKFPKKKKMDTCSRQYFLVFA